MARGLEASRATAAGGITVLSCDNFTGSGDAARAAALGIARILDLGDVVACVAASAITFPNSMVDRITPATSGAVRSSVKDEFGIVDAWPVFAEPFCQWVLEDDFGGARLPLENMNVALALYASALRMLGAPDRPRAVASGILHSAPHVESHAGNLPGKFSGVAVGRVVKGEDGMLGRMMPAGGQHSNCKVSRVKLHFCSGGG